VSCRLRTIGPIGWAVPPLPGGEVGFVETDLDSMEAAGQVGGAELGVQAGVLELVADRADLASVDHEVDLGAHAAADPDGVDPSVGDGHPRPNEPGPVRDQDRATARDGPASRMAKRPCREGEDGSPRNRG
jgi:hypothetical protein